MLSNRTLERVSISYRRGYRDGYDGKTQENQINQGIAGDGVALRPFANGDYESGYKAGKNDRKWNDNWLAPRDPHRPSS